MFFCHAPNYKEENRKLGSADVVWLLTTLSHSLYIGSYSHNLQQHISFQNQYLSHPYLHAAYLQEHAL